MNSPSSEFKTSSESGNLTTLHEWQSRHFETEVLVQLVGSSDLTLLNGHAGSGKTAMINSLMTLVRHRTSTHSSLRKSPDSVIQNHDPCSQAGTDHALFIVFFNGFNSWNQEPLKGLQQKISLALAGSSTRIPFYRGSAIGRSRAATLAEDLSVWSTKTGGRLLIIIDQFERYLEAPFERTGYREFADELVQALVWKVLGVNFLVAVRDDADKQLDRFRSRVPGFGKHYLHLSPLSPSLRAVFSPASDLTGNRRQVKPVLIDTFDSGHNAATEKNQQEAGSDEVSDYGEAEKTEPFSGPPSVALDYERGTLEITKRAGMSKSPNESSAPTVRTGTRSEETLENEDETPGSLEQEADRHQSAISFAVSDRDRFERTSGRQSQAQVPKPSDVAANLRAWEVTKTHLPRSSRVRGLTRIAIHVAVCICVSVVCAGIIWLVMDDPENDFSTGVTSVQSIQR